MGYADICKNHYPIDLWCLLRIINQQTHQMHRYGLFSCYLKDGFHRSGYKDAIKQHAHIIPTTNHKNDKNYCFNLNLIFPIVMCQSDDGNYLQVD